MNKLTKRGYKLQMRQKDYIMEIVNVLSRGENE